MFNFDPDDPYERFVKQQVGLLEEELLGKFEAHDTVSRRFVAPMRRSRTARAKASGHPSGRGAGHGAAASTRGPEIESDWRLFRNLFGQY